jgi:CBS domain containing-hemolysin-like protein
MDAFTLTISLLAAFLAVVLVVRQNQSLFDALDAMLGAHDDVAVVVGDDGQVLGGLPLNTVLRHTHADAGSPVHAEVGPRP